jgi:hypothetical protein
MSSCTGQRNQTCSWRLVFRTVTRLFEPWFGERPGENAFGLLFSLNMLIENREGAEYTGAECQYWMRDIGFTTTYVKPLVGSESVVVGVK